MVPVPQHPDCPPARHAVAAYTSRDLILYALGIGCCSSYDPRCDDGGHDEARFVYEHHEDFRPFPTFPLALAFSAVDEGVTPDFGVRPFPPPTMRGGFGSVGPLPSRFLREDRRDGIDPSLCPLVHVSQSARMHRPPPLPMGRTYDGGGAPYDPPVLVSLSTEIVSVVPKGSGTFLTTETTYRLPDDAYAGGAGSGGGGGGAPLCTSRTTTLLVGVPPDAVVPYRRGDDGGGGGMSDPRTPGSSPPPPRGADGAPDGEDGPAPDSVSEHLISPNQALLYRLSGDYNPLHVDPSLSDFGAGLPTKEGAAMEGSRLRRRRRPVLHGLCTLGYAVRAVLRFANRNVSGKEDGAEVTYVSCRFVKPVLVGDRIRVSVWGGYRDNGGTEKDTEGDRKTSFLCGFQVRNANTGIVVVDDGLVELSVASCEHLPRGNVRSKL